ncbi:MAG TPA: hypothetical protein VID19_12005 [Candidatus Eremiobacteraceae bacterium]
MHSAYGTRQLSIGEIFDRAIHITIANLLPLAAIVGLVDVPIRAIADWLDRAALSRSYGAYGKIVADPRLLASFLTLTRDPHAHPFNWWTLLWTLVALFPLSLAVAAASIASQEFLRGDTPKLGAVYRSAIGRLGPVIGATMLALATYLVAILAVVIALFIFWFVWLFIVAVAGGPANTVPVAGITAMMFFFFAAAMVWIIPLTYCTTTGAALNAIRPFLAWREAWAMTMVRGLRARSLAFGAALLALVLVQEFIRLAVCGFLLDVTHVPLISFVISDAISLLALLIGMALAVVFYLDARNRVDLIQDPLAAQENSQAR